MRRVVCIICMCAISAHAAPTDAQRRLDALWPKYAQDRWTVRVMDEFTWQVRARQMADFYHVPVGAIATAYSDFATHRVYVREQYAVAAPEAALRHTLAHEAGHIWCGCDSETLANAYAYHVLRGDSVEQLFGKK